MLHYTKLLFFFDKIFGKKKRNHLDAIGVFLSSCSLNSIDCLFSPTLNPYTNRCQIPQESAKDFILPARST